jgi:ubiquinone/menaquinone biosynthesis C-methylase UbiE
VNASEVYLLGRSPAEHERLLRQTPELNADAQWLLDQIPIRRGARAIDIGCGPQGILELLSERVGPRGTVVGLEKNELLVAAARRFAAKRGLSNVEIVHGDAKASDLPRESFDLVHTRLVLVNVAEPRRVVDEMLGLVRPGGVVASYEADFLPHVCDPPSPAWDRLFQIYKAYARAQGVDLFIGRTTHRMLREAGLVDIQVRPIIQAFPHRHARRTAFLDFMRNVRVAAICEGLVEESEFNMLLEELARHLDDSRTLVISNLFYQVWGRKPAQQ